MCGGLLRKKANLASLKNKYFFLEFTQELFVPLYQVFICQLQKKTKPLFF